MVELQILTDIQRIVKRTLKNCLGLVSKLRVVEPTLMWLQYRVTKFDGRRSGLHEFRVELQSDRFDADHGSMLTGVAR